MTTGTEPQVEILLATYNGARFLREQLDSLMAQSWQAWHLTASDDGSTDDTVAILDEYATRYPDRIRRIIPPQRFGNARNHFFYLMRQCDSAYMMFCDQDDVWFPTKVEKTMTALLAREATKGADRPILVHTDLIPTDEHLVPLSPSLMRYQKLKGDVSDFRQVVFQNVVTGCATGINRALAALSLQFDSADDIIMHDWWLALVAARFGDIIYLDEATISYRQHGGNAVGAKKVGSFSHVMGKLSQPLALKRTVLNKKRQAFCFLSQHEGKLTSDEISFLTIMSRARSGPVFYWKNRDHINGYSRLGAMVVMG